MTTDKTLRKSRGQFISGVCGGIAAYFGWHDGAVRFFYLLLTFFTGLFPGLVLYIVLGCLMPPPLPISSDELLDINQLKP